MEYEKIRNLLENMPNQPSKFKTKNWVEINDESRGTYSVDSQIKFKDSTLRTNLCNSSDAYIHFLGTITVPNTSTAGLAANNANTKVIIKIMLHLLVA